MKCSQVQSRSSVWERFLTSRLSFEKKKAVEPKYEAKLEKWFFHQTSNLTTRFPRGGAALLNTLIRPVVGHRLLVKGVRYRNVAMVKKVPKFERILVVPDIHIGDAIVMQAAVKAFRDFFPEARIDYIVTKAVGPLIEGNPDISHLYAKFNGSVFPTPEDIRGIRKLVAENDYDICFNASPFFQGDVVFPQGQVNLNFMTVAPQLMRNELDGKGKNHFAFQAYRFITELLCAKGFAAPEKAFSGTTLTLSDEAAWQAEEFLQERGLLGDRPLLFLNPDTASAFTLVPAEYHVKLIQGWLRMGGQVLMGASFKHREMNLRILEALTPEECESVFQTPNMMPIDVYAAIIDLADVFISGDTGPLHLAASRKFSRSGQGHFRNRTMIISLFGGTPAEMSGYDSNNPLYFPANQDAPSRTYVSQSPCRNITCANKLLKTCQNVRCFESLDTDEILSYIQSYLGDRMKISA